MSSKGTVWTHRDQPGSLCPLGAGFHPDCCLTGSYKDFEGCGSDRHLAEAARRSSRIGDPESMDQDRYHPVRIDSASRFDVDFNVLSQSGEEFNQSPDRKISGTVAHQRGDMRLLDSEDFPSFCLCEVAFLNDAINLKR